MSTLADIAWSIRRGNDQILNFTVNLNSLPVDLTGCTGTCLIKSDYGTGATTIGTLTVSFPTPTAGTVRVTMSDAVSAAIAIPAGTADTAGNVPAYAYDVRLTLGADIVTVLRG
jgi:hypothetical protein